PATVNGSGQATLSTSSLSNGNHTVNATYNGDANFNTSASTNITQTINRASTTTALASSANPSYLGDLVSFTATVNAVAPGAGTPTGNVVFKDGATALGTNAL